MIRLVPLVLLLSACAVVDVAATGVSTAVSVTGSVVTTAVDVATSPFRSGGDEKKEE